MAKKRTILIVIVCFSIAVFAGQTLSKKQISPFPPKFLPGMTKEEHKKEIENWHLQRQRQKREKNWSFNNLGKSVVMELRKQTLGITKRQWKFIEPKYKKVETLRREKHVHILTRVHRNREKISSHWKKLTEDNYFRKAKIPAELTKGEKIAEELIDLLENEKSKDQEIRQKMDALQQAREKARKELPQAESELCELLTPRQESVLLLWEFID